MKYEVIILWSQANKAFIAEVPGLPGCMADGPTYAAALKAVESVAKMWIETAESLRRAVPTPEGRLKYAYWYPMTLTYDPTHNIGYVKLRDGPAQVDTLRVSDELNIDIAPDGTVHGIEFLNSNQQLAGDPAQVLTIANEALRT